jgi:hypothetical protein
MTKSFLSVSSCSKNSNSVRITHSHDGRNKYFNIYMLIIPKNNATNIKKNNVSFSVLNFRHTARYFLKTNGSSTFN